MERTVSKCAYIYSPRGRLLHGRHFTYKSITGDTAITFVSTGVEGAFATEEHPYAAHGPWLQVRSPLFLQSRFPFLGLHQKKKSSVLPYYIRAEDLLWFFPPGSLNCSERNF